MKTFSSSFLCISFSSIIFLSSLLSLDAASEHKVGDETPFTYIEETGKGPKRWGDINPKWRVCETGKMQSPIDLLQDERVEVRGKLGKLQRDYKPTPARIINRGHDIEVIWLGDAGSITINGTKYSLKKCHWHSPSEHTLNSKRYKMELHMVHVSDKGGIAVVGILYTYGHKEPFLAKLAKHVSKTIGKEEDLGVLCPGSIKFGSRKYYRYIGSLTTPPCTEGVIWTISKKVRTVSREQLNELREMVRDGYESNARPLQDLGDRDVEMFRPEVA